MTIVVDRKRTVGEGAMKRTVECFSESGVFSATTHVIDCSCIRGTLISYISICPNAVYTIRFYSGKTSQYFFTHSLTAGESRRPISLGGYLGIPVVEGLTIRYLSVAPDETYTIKVFYETI